MVLQTKFAEIKNNNLYIDDVNACDLAGGKADYETSE